MRLALLASGAWDQTSLRVARRAGCRTPKLDRCRTCTRDGYLVAKLIGTRGTPVQGAYVPRRLVAPRRIVTDTVLWAGGFLYILSLMANKEIQLAGLFYALGDVTRLGIVGALGHGPASVSVLAAPFAMSLPSFMKHLAVLERTGLVRSSKVGRTRTCELSPRALTQAEQWMSTQRATWDARSDRMTAFVENLHQEQPSHVRRPRRPA